MAGSEHPRSRTTEQVLQEIRQGHGGNAGPSLVEKIQAKLDSVYQSWSQSWKDGTLGLKNQELLDNRRWGRVEGVAAALGILRGTSTAVEIAESEARLGLQ